MIKITIECCGGKERYPGQCLKKRCPNYAQAEESVQRNWPWLPTGFGNAYGYPKHPDILRKVREDLNQSSGLQNE